MSVLSKVVATCHRWLLNTGDVPSATEELNFLFYFILIQIEMKSPRVAESSCPG